MKSSKINGNKMMVLWMKNKAMLFACTFLLLLCGIRYYSKVESKDIALKVDSTLNAQSMRSYVLDESKPHCLFSDHGGHSSVRYVGPMPLDPKLKTKFENLTFYQCGFCGSYFVWPILEDEELSWLYTQVYDHNEMVKHSSYLENQAKSRAIWQFRLIAEYIPRMTRQKDLSVLEQGCNEGLLLSHFHNISAHITCFEPAPSAKVATNYPDVTLYRNVKVGDEVPDGSIDIHMSSHVAEHVARPREFFETAHRKLRVGGILFAEIPHYAGNDDWMLRSNPINFHLTYFTPQAARIFLTEIGFCELFTGYTEDNKGFEENYSRQFKKSPETYSIPGVNLRILYQKCHT